MANNAFNESLIVRCGGDKVAADVRDVVAFGALDGIADVRDGGSVKGKNKAAELMKVLLGQNNGDVVVFNSDTCSSFGSTRNHDSE